MALEVNNQNPFQNAQFRQFVDFAENAVKAGFKAAMRSENGLQMHSAMLKLNDGDFPPGCDISQETRHVIQHRVARSLGLSFHEATWTTINTALGKPPEYDTTTFMQRPVEAESFRKITDIIARHVEEVYGSNLYDV